MNSTANASQFDAWNGDSGTRWAANADLRDQVLAPVGDAMLAAAQVVPGLNVLDVGCGCGVTTLAAGERVTGSGSAVGVDLSGPMLALARQRAEAGRATNVTFVNGDAQTHPFKPGGADLVISRFGTMFFSDPVAAFRNIASALSDGGRLCMATWQPLAANDWLTVPGAALLKHGELPPSEPGAPGMFAQSDPRVISSTLSEAGFRDIRSEPVEVTFTLGQTVEAALGYLADSGPGRALIDSIPLGPKLDAAMSETRIALEPHLDASGVRLGGGIWITTATRSLERPTRRNTHEGSSGGAARSSDRSN